MPPLAHFESAEKFFATLGHEHVHYTKAPDRLDRSFGASTFGNEAYAKEELVALS
jgi:antirestriction protein ArdC